MKIAVQGNEITIKTDEIVFNADIPAEALQIADACIDALFREVDHA